MEFTYSLCKQIALLNLTMNLNTVKMQFRREITVSDFSHGKLSPFSRRELGDLTEEQLTVFSRCFHRAQAQLHFETIMIRLE